MAFSERKFFQSRRWARRCLVVAVYAMLLIVGPVVLVMLTWNWLRELPRDWLEGPFTEFSEFVVEMCRRGIALWRK